MSSIDDIKKMIKQAQIETLRNHDDSKHGVITKKEFYDTSKAIFAQKAAAAGWTPRPYTPYSIGTKPKQSTQQNQPAYTTAASSIADDRNELLGMIGKKTVGEAQDREAKAEEQRLKSRIDAIDSELNRANPASSYLGQLSDPGRGKVLLEERSRLSRELAEAARRGNHSERDVVSKEKENAVRETALAQQHINDGYAANPLSRNSQEDMDRYRNELGEMDSANTREGTLDYVDKYIDREKKDTFTGQFGANYDIGRMNQDSSLAWNEYINNPTKENRERAETIDKMVAVYAQQNAAALDDQNAVAPWITKSLANYVPQALDQLKYQAGGAAVGALTMNPAFIKAGITAGSGLYSFQTMQGAAFKALLEAGVDEETARRAAMDEAVVSSLLEMGDTVVDLATLGGGKALDLLAGGGKVVAKKAAEKGLLQKLAPALLKYGINILGEGAQEGLQEGVSIANTERDGTGMANLAGEAAKVLWNAAKNKTDPNRQQILSAGAEGAKLAAMLGLAEGGTNAFVSKALTRQQAIDELGAELAAKSEPAPERSEAEKKLQDATDRFMGVNTEEQAAQNQPQAEQAQLDTTIAETLGVQPEAQSAIDTAAPAEYDNNTIAVPGATVGRSGVTYTADTATEISMFDTGERQTQEGLYDEAVTAYDKQRDGKGRIPEKSDFSQYRQYEPGKLAGSMDGSSAEGNSGAAASDGRIPQTVPADAPGGRRPVTEQNPGIKGTGAAEQNFTGKAAYQDLLYDGNVQRDRPSDVRPMEIPKTDGNGRRVTEVASDAYGAAVTSDATANTIEQMILDGELGFEKVTNKEALDAARTYIDSGSRSRKDVEAEIRQNVDAGRIQDGDLEKALLLYAEYASKEDETSQRNAASVLLDVAEIGHRLGRQLQMMKVLRQLTPEGQLAAVQQDVNRYVDGLNRKRSPKDKIGEAGAESGNKTSNKNENETGGSADSVESATKQAEQDVKKEIESLQEELEKPTNSRKRRERRKQKSSPTEGKEGQVFVFEYAETVGDAVAKGIKRSMKPEKKKTAMEVLASEIMKFASEKMPKKNREKPLTAVELLRDYVQNQEFYSEAWELAQQKLRDEGYSGTAADGFINSGIGVDANNNPKNTIMAKALAKAAAESGETAKVLEMQNALGATGMAAKISDYLISETGATGEMAQTIRDAAKHFVDDKLRETDSSDNAQLVETAVRGALRDIGVTLTQTAVQGKQAKTLVASQIAKKLTQKYGITIGDSHRIAHIAVGQFEKMVDARAKEILKQRFAPKAAAQKKSTGQKLREYGNLGAFDEGSRYNTRATSRVLGTDGGISINPELARKFLDAKTDADKEAALVEIYQDVAARIPSTLEEKLDVLRHTAMLLNPKTHLRNMLSTAGFRPLSSLKRAVGAVVESVAVGKKNRTKAILGFGKNSRELLKWAAEDAKSKDTQKAMKYTATTGDEARSIIDEYRKIWGNKLLDGLPKWNTETMEKEDMFFKRREYALSLASFLKARGYTAEAISKNMVPESVLAEGRALAIQEAMKATFNDRNKLSDALARMKPKGSSFGAKVGRMMFAGVAPYTRTPANVVVRIKEYSPLEFGTAIAKAVEATRDGDPKALTDAIDSFASALTGTGMISLGAAMAAGWIPGVLLHGEVDDEEREEGAIPYSLQVGDTYFSLSQFAPAAVPMLVGANLHKSLKEANVDGDIDGWDVAGILADMGSATVDPVVELSVLSGINDAIDNLKYEETGGDKTVAFATTAAMNYLTQFFPTIIGQAEQATETVKTKTLADGESSIERSIKKQLGKITQRIPGVDAYQVTRRDALGQPVENEGGLLERSFNAFLNPFNTSKKEDDPVITEIMRVNREQEEKVAPPDVPKKVSWVDNTGEKHTDTALTAEQTEKYADEWSNTVKTILTAAMGRGDYKGMTEAQKARVIDKTYEYATERAREAVLPNYHRADKKWVDEIKDAPVSGIIARANASAIDSVIDDAVERINNGWELKPELQKQVDEIYSSFAKMPLDDKVNILAETDSNTERYLEVRSKGVSTDVFMDAVQRIQALKPEGDNNTVSAAQKYETIATSGLSEKDRDALILSYMPDYNPEAKSPVTTELKYLYAREQLGIAPEDYVQFVRIEDSESGRGKKNRVIDKYASYLGGGRPTEKSRSTAAKVYELMNGRKKKPWEEEGENPSDYADDIRKYLQNQG